MLQVMSFIEIRNSIGPNTVPCVAPESTLFRMNYGPVSYGFSLSSVLLIFPSTTGRDSNA